MEPREKEFDLLTAALLGLAVGAVATFLLRRGPSGRRPIATGLEAAGHGAIWAGAAGLTGAKAAGRMAADRTRHGVERGMELWDDLSFDEMGERIGDYLEAAKGAIEDTVKGELQDLRKSIHRQRKRLGV